MFSVTHSEFEERTVSQGSGRSCTSRGKECLRQNQDLALTRSRFVVGLFSKRESKKSVIPKLIVNQ